MPRIFSILTHPSLPIISWLVVLLHRLTTFTFAEIGVFKGDNAMLVAHWVRPLNVSFHNIGFDLFDDSEAFYKENLSEYDFFKSGQSKYWEFDSALNTYDNVYQKIKSQIAPTQFNLVKGDSLTTVPERLQELETTDLFYIDGAHDYEYVHQDWENVKLLFKNKSNLVVVFDDLGFEGVRRVKDEIDQDSNFVSFYLNHNQFFVLSSHLSIFEKSVFTVASSFFKGILHLKKILTGGRRKA